MAFQVLPPGPQKRSFAQKLSEGVGKGLDTASELVREYKKQEYQKKERQSVADFLNSEYNIKNAENLPQNFQLEMMKGKNSNANRFAGKLSPEEKMEQNDIVNRALRNEATQEELATLEPNLQTKIMSATKPRAEKPKQLSPFEKQKQVDAAKQYKEDKIQVQKINDNLANIDRMKELSEELQGISGYIKAYLGTGKASEFDALGLAAIEPVLKIFNPVGAIPTQKINLIKEKYAPKASDRQSTINGKLRALEGLNKQALARAQQRISLMDEYEGNVPGEILDAFDNESADYLDAILDSETSSGMPSPSDHKGKKIKNNETGKIFVSDGKKWNLI